MASFHILFHILSLIAAVMAIEARFMTSSGCVGYQAACSNMADNECCYIVHGWQWWNIQYVFVPKNWDVVMEGYGYGDGNCERKHNINFAAKEAHPGDQGLTDICLGWSSLNLPYTATKWHSGKTPEILSKRAPTESGCRRVDTLGSPNGTQYSIHDLDDTTLQNFVRIYPSQ